MIRNRTPRIQVPGAPAPHSSAPDHLVHIGHMYQSSFQIGGRPRLPPEIRRLRTGLD